MTADRRLMDDLERAVSKGSREERMETLRRVTDLFLTEPARLSTEQIGVFDDVLSHLVSRVETRARAELARRLAPVDQAPHEVICQLANDEEILVAGPVLAQSNKLTTADLVAIAQQKGQGHLLAIAGRDTLDGEVTDVLVNRGNRDVVTTLASNSGATFSDTGYQTLVGRAEEDETLAEKLGRRLDIPLQLFRDLLLRAAEVVRERLLSSVSDDKQNVIRDVVKTVSSQIAKDVPAVRDIEQAKRLALMMKETGRLNEVEIMNFARQKKPEETLAGLAQMCSAPFELIDRLAQSDQSDALLIPCKAAGMRWATVRAVLELSASQRANTRLDFESAEREYSSLSSMTAARVLRFWLVRGSTQLAEGA
jgi:uncharacterized protein (DUF2336 family)